MNDRLRDAYYGYVSELVRAGIIDDSLNQALLEGRSVEEHMVEFLRSAGKLPPDWDAESSHQGARDDSQASLVGASNVTADPSDYSHVIQRSRVKVRSLTIARLIEGSFSGAALVGPGRPGMLPLKSA